MKRIQLYLFLQYCFATVWAANAIVKIFVIVPRHQAIVARFFEDRYAGIITFLIACAELLMGFWIVSRFHSRICALTQILVIITMNVLENIYARDLLLYGNYNLVFAIFLCGLIAVNEFLVKSSCKISADA